MKLERDGIKVVWEDIGEGWSGDYDEDDPEDEPLLRFSVYMQQDRYMEFYSWRNPDYDFMERDGVRWYAPQDSSYCTAMPVGTAEEILRRGLERIWASVDDDGCGKNLEELSWMNPDWFVER